MARLTRTQKFAELRNQLENAPEAEIKTEELTKFENKMDDLNITPVTKVEEDVTPIIPVTPITPIVEKPEVEETPVVTEEVTPITTLNGLSSILEEKTEEKKDEFVPFNFGLEEIKPIVEEITPVVEEETVEEITPVIEETTSTVKEDKEEEIIPVIPFIDEPIVEETKVEEVTSVVEDVLPEIVNDKPVSEINTEYLSEALKEVDEYNKSRGLLTAEEVPSAIAEGIRGVSKPEEEQKEPLTEAEDLSNTVTMEIKKILSELDSQNTVVDKATEDSNTETESEELPAEYTELLKSFVVDDEPKSEIEQLMNKGLTTVEDEIAEVKKEMQATKDNSLLNETIPFEMTSSTIVTQKPEDVEEYDEEPGPNKILNVILIILILVLVAILGFIGYLILVAQGIIG